MNREQLISQVNHTCHKLMETKGYVSPVDVFLELDKLSEENYKNWRMKKIPYLERVIQINLNKCSCIMEELRSLAQKHDWKPSKTAYFSWGKGKKIDLQFSKSGDRSIEEQYRTHYLRKKGEEK